MIYKLLMTKCKKLYITQIKKEFAWNTFFTEINKNEWKIIKEEIGSKDDNDFEYRYIDYLKN